MRKAARYIFMICVMVLAVGAANCLYAAPLPATLFSDDFSSGNADNWSPFIGASNSYFGYKSSWWVSGQVYYGRDPAALWALSLPTPLATPVPSTFAYDVDLFWSVGLNTGDTNYGVGGIEIFRDRTLPRSFREPYLFAWVNRYSVSGAPVIKATVGYSAAGTGTLTKTDSAVMGIGTGLYHLQLKRTGSIAELSLTGAESPISLSVDLTGKNLDELQQFNLATYFSQWGYDNVVISTTGGTMAGQITLEDYAGDLSLVPIRIEAKQGDNVVSSQEIRLSQNPGQYSVDLAPDTYDMVFSACKWLSQVVQNVTITTDNTTPVSVSLQNGDINGDNHVGRFDFNILSGNFDHAGD